MLVHTVVASSSLPVVLPCLEEKLLDHFFHQLDVVQRLLRASRGPVVDDRTEELIIRAEVTGYVLAETLLLQERRLVADIVALHTVLRCMLRVLHWAGLLPSLLFRQEKHRAALQLLLKLQVALALMQRDNDVLEKVPVLLNSQQTLKLVRFSAGWQIH